MQTFGVVDLSANSAGSPQGECVVECPYDDEFSTQRYQFLPTALCVYGTWDEEWEGMSINEYIAPNDFCSDGHEHFDGADETSLQSLSHTLADRFTGTGLSDSDIENRNIHLDGYGVWHDYRKYRRAHDGTEEITS